MNAMVETAVDYKKFFEETARELFQCKNTLAKANDNLADTRGELDKTLANFNEYRANMQIVVFGGGVVIITLVLVVVFMAAKQSVSV
jgi:t-SNARE complex subunit (syntaxin)